MGLQRVFPGGTGSTPGDRQVQGWRNTVRTRDEGWKGAGLVHRQVWCPLQRWGRQESGNYFVHNEEKSQKLSTQAGSPQNQQNCMNHHLPAASTTEQWSWSKASAAWWAWRSRKHGPVNHTRRLLFSHTAVGYVSVLKDACEILLVLVTANHNTLKFSRVTSKGRSSQPAVSHWWLGCISADRLRSGVTW